MKHTRLYTAILLGVILLNITKHQLPYLEYNLFKNYIAENLCVKKNEANNCCQGKCFLEKQIGLVNETDEQSANPNGQKQIYFGVDYYIVKDNIEQKPNFLNERLLLFFKNIHIIKISIEIPIPPP
ncbi:MAG: hypothetical protein LBT50_01955 [Prevotellaceae bacterium]|jgi:hypothetical protein|nr:hypothetical protein [Prevotellaceae bacterium]